MFKLRVEVPDEEPLRRALEDEAFVATVHVDRAVQTVESEFETRFTPPPQQPQPPPPPSLRTRPPVECEPCEPRLPEPPSGFSTPEPRSESASPWPADDNDGEGEAVGESSGGATGRCGVERQLVPFSSGLPSGELCAGAISFYRFAQPSGVLGLRPPPLRSNLIALLAVPTSLSNADLLRFIGGYLRYVRHMRLVRDDSAQQHVLLLQFGAVGAAECFRRDFHGKRYNSLEPEVALAVHVAHVEVSAPAPPQPAPARVQMHLRVTTLARGFDGGLHPPTLTRQGSADASGPALSPFVPPGEPAGSSEAPAEGWRVAVQLQPTSKARDANAERRASACRTGDELAPSPAPLAARSLHAPHGASVQASTADLVVAQLAMAMSMPQPPVPRCELTDMLERNKRVEMTPLELGALLGEAVELPTCAVCLERLDPSVTGVFTIVCNHSFHCDCLRRWADATCPVCRHVQDELSSQTTCQLCGTPVELWICLVCGHVGCGRYGCGAGVLHNERTGHNFAMELSSQRVWDYAGDNYVHRLIQNKVDGKLVELPDVGRRQLGMSSADGGESSLDAGADGAFSGGDEATLEMKQRGMETRYEEVVHEYSVLLTGQLEVQRGHYEARLSETGRAHAAQLADMQHQVTEQASELDRVRNLLGRESKDASKRVSASDAQLARARREVRHARLRRHRHAPCSAASVPRRTSPGCAERV
jgi:hypothetical protein